MNRFFKTILALSLLATVAQSSCMENTKISYSKKAAKYAWLLTKLVGTGLASTALIINSDFSSLDNKEKALTLTILGANLGVFGESIYELYKETKDEIRSRIREYVAKWDFYYEHGNFDGRLYRDLRGLSLLKRYIAIVRSQPVY